MREKSFKAKAINLTFINGGLSQTPLALHPDLQNIRCKTKYVLQNWRGTYKIFDVVETSSQAEEDTCLRVNTLL